MEKMAEQVQSVCNHCGGKLTMNGEILSCLMCGREADHSCALCLMKSKPAGKPNAKKKAPSRKKKPASKK